MIFGFISEIFFGDIAIRNLPLYIIFVFKWNSFEFCMKLIPHFCPLVQQTCCSGFLRPRRAQNCGEQGESGDKGTAHTMPISESLPPLRTRPRAPHMRMPVRSRVKSLAFTRPRAAPHSLLSRGPLGGHSEANSQVAMADDR